MNHGDTWWKSVPSKGYQKCKGPEAETQLPGIFEDCGDGSMIGLEISKVTGNKMIETLASRSKILALTLIWKTTGRFLGDEKSYPSYVLQGLFWLLVEE